MHEFHRILDGDDVAVTEFSVAMVDHRGERVVDLPDPVAPTTMITSPRLVITTSFSTCGDAELVDGRDLGGDGPQHETDAPLLDERVDAEAPDARGLIAKLHSFVASNSEACLSFMIRARQLGGMLRGHRLVRHRRDLAVDLERRRKLGGDEEIGTLLAEHQAQQVVT